MKRLDMLRTMLGISDRGVIIVNMPDVMFNNMTITQHMRLDNNHRPYVDYTLTRIPLIRRVQLIAEMVD